MSVIAKSAKGTPIVITRLAAGSYTVSAGSAEYRIFKYSDCTEAAHLNGMWSVSLTNIDPWYSDPIFTKADCVSAVIDDINQKGL